MDMSVPAAEEPRTRGHKKKERTRRRLVQAAIEVIAERGEAFSVGDVVERAGVANGTFYNYFDDRESLIAAVVPEMLMSLTDHLAQVVTDDDPVQRFATSTAMAMRRAAIAPYEMRALLRTEALQAAMGVAGPLNHLRADLAAGVAAGRFTIVDAEAALDVVAGAVLMTVRRVLERGPDTAHEAAVIVHLLRSLGVPGRRATTIADQAVSRAGSVEPAG